MKWFLNAKTWVKLAIGFGLVTLLTIAVGICGCMGMAKLNAIQRQLAQDALPGTGFAGKIAAGIRSVKVRQMRVSITEDLKALPLHLEEYNKDLAKVEENLSAYEGTITQPEDRKNFNEFKAAWNKNRELDGKCIALASAGNSAGARKILDGESRELYNKSLVPMLDKIMEWNITEGKKQSAKAEETNTEAFEAIVFLTALGVVLSVLIATFIGRTVSRVITEVFEHIDLMSRFGVPKLHAAMEAMAEYDLTAETGWKTEEMAVRSKDDLSQMAERVNSLIVNLRETVMQFQTVQGNLSSIVGRLGVSAATVNDTAGALTSATEQTGRASTEIADGSEKLARTAGEAAATMEKLHEAVRKVKDGSETQFQHIADADAELKGAAEIAAQVATSAQSVAAVAAEGRKKVERIVKSNNEINAQVGLSSEKVSQLDTASQQIGTIVQSIEQIAEQTNLLALNAAIEAARAGEHGRGFAVVAEEVRKLAEEASAATKQIVDLIDNVRANVAETVASINGTVPLVEAGTALTQEAGDSLDEIAAAAEKVAVDAEGVAKTGAGVAQTMAKVRDAATRNQELTEHMAAGAEQVSGAIQGVAAVSQETAAGAEELSATAEEVSASAIELNSMASELKQVVTKFKTDAGEGSTVIELKRAA